MCLYEENLVTDHIGEPIDLTDLPNRYPCHLWLIRAGTLQFYDYRKEQEVRKRQRLSECAA